MSGKASWWRWWWAEYKTEGREERSKKGTPGHWHGMSKIPSGVGLRGRLVIDQKSEKCWHFHGSEKISVGIEPGVWKER